jgi:hypothetical protein
MRGVERSDKNNTTCSPFFKEQWQRIWEIVRVCASISAVWTIEIIQVSMDVAVIPAKAGIQKDINGAKHTEYLAEAPC